MKTKVFTRGGACIWEGCDATFNDKLPAGWVWLITYWSPWPEGDRTVAEVCCDPFSKQDGALCSAHTEKLGTLLKDIGGRLRDVAGSA